MAPFAITIPESQRDPLLAQRVIVTELSGVLAWPLEGLVRLQLRGAFDPALPAATRAVLAKIRCSWLRCSGTAIGPCS